MSKCDNCLVFNTGYPACAERCTKPEITVIHSDTSAPEVTELLQRILESLNEENDIQQKLLEELHNIHQSIENATSPKLFR